MKPAESRTPAARSAIAGLIGLTTLMRTAAMAAGLAALASPAAAQNDIKAVEPYVAVVTMDNAPMRCSNGVQLFYPVRELKSGELIRVNGEGPGWLRVEYPPGMRAYVAAGEVEAAKDGQSVKLTKPSRLLAVPADGKRPWWPLDLDADIPAGTALKVVKPSQGSDNVIDGYFVEAPPKARGFVKSEQARKASAEEAARYVGASGSAAAAKPAAPGAGESKPATPAGGTPAPAGATPSGPSAPAGSGTAPAPTVTNPPAPGTPPGFNPSTPTVTPVNPASGATPPGTAPAAGTPGEANPGVAPAPTTPVAPAPPPPPPPKRDEEMDRIRTTFDNVMSSGGDAEIPGVIDLFEKRIARLGDSPQDRQVRSALEQRLSALKLRQEINAQRERVRELNTSRRTEVQRVALIVAEAQRQAIYNMVGRIQPSTVYDGKRGMPLMYRVESADALSPRTVGYIVPTEGTDLLTKIGKVCGIVGDTRFDQSLQLNIVAPRRIDVLDVGATATGAGAPMQPPATGQAPPQGSAPQSPPSAPPGAPGQPSSGGQPDQPDK